MDRQPDRGVRQRSSGARSSRRRIVGAGRRGAISGTARRQHRQYRRLYVRRRRSLQTFQYPHLQGGIYNIPQVGLRIRTVLTNTTPIGVTRGPGFAEAINVIERLIDAAARQCGFDRATLRRRNMARTPMTNALGYAVDSGAFAETFDKRSPPPICRAFPRAGATAKRAVCCAVWALPATSRPPAAIRRKMSIFGSSDDGSVSADHRHANHRPGSRNDLSADPGALSRAFPTIWCGWCRATPA